MNFKSLFENDIYAIPAGDIWNVPQDKLYLMYSPLSGHILIVSQEEFIDIENVCAGKKAGTDIQNNLLDKLKGQRNQNVYEIPDSCEGITEIDILMNFKCNFKCSYCYSAAGRSSKEVSFEHIVELINALTEKYQVDHIAGIIFREERKLVKTLQRKEIVSLDELPFPDYEGFDYRTYLKENPDISDDGEKHSQVSVIGGRSCKYNCTFCFHPSGTTYRQRSLDSIFAEIDFLVSNYDISYIALREELFATDNKRVEEFCLRIKPYNLIWSIQLRIDSINQELVDLLKDTRCRYVFVGVESASNEVLRSMRKGINVSQIENALNMLNDAGLNSRSGVIFGDSVETFDTAMHSLEWFMKNRNCYRMFVVDMIIAFPGSILYKRACKDGIISDPVQFLKDGCPIVNLSKMNTIEFRQLVQLVENINQRHYVIADYDKLVKVIND